MAWFGDRRATDGESGVPSGLTGFYLAAFAWALYGVGRLASNDAGGGG